MRVMLHPRVDLSGPPFPSPVLAPAWLLCEQFWCHFAGLREVSPRCSGTGSMRLRDQQYPEGVPERDMIRMTSRLKPATDAGYMPAFSLGAPLLMAR